MISNEDYADIRKNSNDLMTVVYQYYTATYGKIHPGIFTVKFQLYCKKQKKLVEFAVPDIVNYLDVKHTYICFIENWK